MYWRNSWLLHRPPRTGSQFADFIQLVSANCRLAVVWTYPTIEIEGFETMLVSFGWVKSKLLILAKIMTDRTQNGLSGVVRVRKCSISCCFLSWNEPAKQSARMVSRNFQLLNVWYTGFGLPWTWELLWLSASKFDDSRSLSEFWDDILQAKIRHTMINRSRSKFKWR